MLDFLVGAGTANLHEATPSKKYIFTAESAVDAEEFKDNVIASHC